MRALQSFWRHFYPAATPFTDTPTDGALLSELVRSLLRCVHCGDERISGAVLRGLEQLNAQRRLYARPGTFRPHNADLAVQVALNMLVHRVHVRLTDEAYAFVFHVAEPAITDFFTRVHCS